MSSNRFADEAGETLAPPDGWDLVAVDAELGGIEGESRDALAARRPLRGDADAHWVRACYDPENQHALGLFAAPAQPEAIASPPGIEARRVVELRPGDYLA